MLQELRDFLFRGNVVDLAVAVVIGGAFAAALPATFDFVKFMGIDTTWVLELRFDLVFSVFIVFMVAHLPRVWRRYHGASAASSASPCAGVSFPATRSSRPSPIRAMKNRAKP